MWERIQQILRPEIIILVWGDTIWSFDYHGQMVQEPIRLLVDTKLAKVVAYGRAARPIELAAGGAWQVVVPFSSQNWQDEHYGRLYLRWLFGQLCGSLWIFRPRVIVLTAGSTSSFWRELWLQTMAAVGAREVVFLHPFLAISNYFFPGADREDAYHLVALWQGDQLRLGVVTRGHVQAEWSGKVTNLATSVAVWRQWWQGLAPDIREIVERQGILLASDLPTTDWLTLTKQWDIPVVGVPIGQVLQGARRIKLPGII